MEKESRPWGCYEVLADEASHKIKRITVTPGRRLSYQRHRLRAEHWFVLSGCGLMTIDGSDRLVDGGMSIDIACGAAHRIKSNGPEPLVMIEIQTGKAFLEEDIERLEDDYGRV